MRYRGNLGYLSVTAVAAAMLAPGAVASADVVDVSLMHGTFMVDSPVPGEGTPHATIQLGDTVRWTWLSDFHSVTSDTPLFDSGVNSQPFSFEFTFSELGEFAYHCSIHGGAGGVGMSGTVTVVPAPAALSTLAAAGLLAARRRRPVG